MKIAKLHMDAQDKLRFEIIGKSSVKYHLKANHQVEAKRWFWALNNAIQFSKDEAKEAERAQNRSSEMLRQAKLAQTEKNQPKDAESGSLLGVKSGAHLVPGSTPGAARSSVRTGSGSDMLEEEDGVGSTYDGSTAGDEVIRLAHSYGTTAIEGDRDADEDPGDDASEVEAHPVKKDAFFIAAHSARLQLEMLSQISAALQQEKDRNPTTTISDSTVVQALASYDAAVANLNGLIGDLGRIARDREAYWHYRLEQEMNVRRIWEDNMMRVAKEQEELENRIGESEEKRKQAKRALRDVLDGQVDAQPDAEEVAKSPEVSFATPHEENDGPVGRSRTFSAPRRKSTMADITNIAASDDEDEADEFFDAVDAGEIEIVEELPKSVTSPPLSPSHLDGVAQAGGQSKTQEIQKSSAGYEEPVRKRLKMDADDRPKISLWVCYVIIHTGELADRCLGHSKIHDWKRYDEDDPSCIV